MRARGEEKEGEKQNLLYENSKLNYVMPAFSYSYYEISKIKK